MQGFRKVSLMTALALCAFPVFSPAGEAPAAGAAAPAQSQERSLAEAQRRLDAAAREVAELSRQMGRRFNMRLGVEPGMGPPPRALLGIGVGNGGEKDGAHVMEVSPGGAAAEAGLKPGDVITAIGGEDLTKDTDPGRALVEKMRQIDPGLKVQVTVLRGGTKMNFDVTPRPAPPPVALTLDDLANLGNLGDLGSLGDLGNMGNPPGGDRRGPGPRGESRAFGSPQIRERIIEARGMPGEADNRFDGAEFASLSERLGSYFGVKAGVLVVRAGVSSPLKLQDGDVILSIDGRDATTAQQAGRILRSYQPGEKLSLKVQRDRKVQTLESTAPGGRRN